MAERKHVEMLSKGFSGVLAWNKWRGEHPEIRPNLVEANLRTMNLCDADLHGADLQEADLRRADLSAANLRETDAQGANFHETRLISANLSGANMTSALLSYARLRDADLRKTVLSSAILYRADLRRANLAESMLNQTDLGGANLRGADVTGAMIAGTTFGNCDLRETIGLDTIRHISPSTIDLISVFQFQARIPVAFLRGLGVPEFLIEYLPSVMVSNPIQFYSCFISYSTKDQKFADRLYVDLQNKGVRCWFAPHDVQGGKKLHEQIDDAIRMHERLLLLLSPDSMNSEWVKTEIRKARKRERAEKKRVLFPVRLVSFDAIRDWELFDADEGKDLAVEIREFYIPDFSEWKNPDPYQKEFEKLLRDLRTDGTNSK
jgi:hypothetical protein